MHILQENSDFVLLLNCISELDWFILIPKIENVKNIAELSKSQYQKLSDLIHNISIIVKEVYNPDQVNVAMLGNVTPQLHCHIIPRFEDDFCWPRPIFTEKMTKIDTKSNENITKVSQEVEKLFNNSASC